jgi:hypothetical protein
MFPLIYPNSSDETGAMVQRPHEQKIETDATQTGIN